MVHQHTASQFIKKNHSNTGSRTPLPSPLPITLVFCEHAVVQRLELLLQLLFLLLQLHLQLPLPA